MTVSPKEGCDQEVEQPAWPTLSYEPVPDGSHSIPTRRRHAVLLAPAQSGVTLRGREEPVHVADSRYLDPRPFTLMKPALLAMESRADRLGSGHTYQIHQGRVHVKAFGQQQFRQTPEAFLLAAVPRASLPTHAPRDRAKNPAAECPSLRKQLAATPEARPVPWEQDSSRCPDAVQAHAHVTTRSAATGYVGGIASGA